MEPGYLRTLYAHGRWANRRVLDAAARLPPERFRDAEHPSFGSIRNAFVHVVAVQRTWLARAQGREAPPVLDPEDVPDVAALRALWDRVDAETDPYVVAVDGAALGEIVRYVNRRGEPNAYPRWQILVHQAAHAGQHRSELALLLTRLGHSPGWLDVLVFLDEREADRRAV